MVRPKAKSIWEGYWPEGAQCLRAHRGTLHQGQSPAMLGGFLDSNIVFSMGAAIWEESLLLNCHGFENLLFPNKGQNCTYCPNTEAPSTLLR